VRLHQFLAEQNPCQRGEERGHNQQVSGECRFSARYRALAAAQGDERRAHSGTEESQPCEAVKPFFVGTLAGKERGGSGDKNRHGAHHEGSVADRGSGKAVKLEQKLEGNADEGAKEQQTGFGGGEPEAAAMDEGHGQHAQGSKEKAVEHHVLDAHLVEREAAEVEARAPQAGRHKEEVERLMGCEIDSEHYATAIEILGQGVQTRIFREILQQLAGFLKRVE